MKTVAPSAPFSNQDICLQVVLALASTVSGRPQQADLISKDQSEQTLELVTELAELGGKHVVSAVAQMPNLDPEKKTQFESVGLTGVTPEETARLNSLLKEV